MNNFGRGPPKDHLCEIISKLGQGFTRSCHLSQLLTDERQTKTDHKSSPCHFVTGELKLWSANFLRRGYVNEILNVSVALSSLRRYIFLWVVAAESFQIIWVIGVRPNLITWVVGVSLCGRGRKNIICQKKREVFI